MRECVRVTYSVSRRSVLGAPLRVFVRLAVARRRSRLSGESDTLPN